MAVAVDVHELTRQLAQHEQFGLCRQIRRAAVSVPSNIAEGAAFAKLDEVGRLLTAVIRKLNTRLCGRD